MKPDQILFFSGSHVLQWLICAATRTTLIIEVRSIVLTVNVRLIVILDLLSKRRESQLMLGAER